MSNGFILDTSAVFTFLENEPGADRVEDILKQKKAWLPWIALMETYYVTQQEQGQAVADQRYAAIKKLPVTILWEATESVLLVAARLKAVHRISLGDAIIAGFAVVYGATLLHKDPEFETLAGKVTLETLPYKSVSI